MNGQIETLVSPWTEIEAGPIRVQTDNIGEAYGVTGIFIIIAVVLRLVWKHL